MRNYREFAITHKRCVNLLQVAYIFVTTETLYCYTRDIAYFASLILFSLKKSLNSQISM